MKKLCILFLFTIAAFTLPAFSQSLDEVIDQSAPPDGVTAAPDKATSAADHQVIEPGETFAREIVTDFPMGIPTLDRFFGFLDGLIRKILAQWKREQAEPGVVTKPTAPANPGSPGKPTTPAKPSTSAKKNPQPSGENPNPVPASTPNAVPTNGGIPFPPTPSGAETGSEFIQRTATLDPSQREQAILKEILSGNVPDFLRTLKEVKVKMKLSDGKEHTVAYKVLPDYLAIGTNADFIRIPMSPIAAQAIASKFGCMLPTTKMVDDIYKQAQTQLNPQPMSGGKYPNWQARMTRNEFYSEHQKLVEKQRTQSGHQLGDLIAGHKKDVVISNFLDSHPKNVVIYGWHDKSNGGKPIQGYGWGHENAYADYSHGIRLISQTMTLDGREVAASEVLKDPTLSRLLSNEGPVKNLSATR